MQGATWTFAVAYMSSFKPVGVANLMKLQLAQLSVYAGDSAQSYDERCALHWASD